MHFTCLCLWRLWCSAMLFFSDILIFKSTKNTDNSYSSISQTLISDDLNLCTAPEGVRRRSQWFECSFWSIWKFCNKLIYVCSDFNSILTLSVDWQENEIFLTLNARFIELICWLLTVNRVQEFSLHVSDLRLILAAITFSTTFPEM